MLRLEVFGETVRVRGSAPKQVTGLASSCGVEQNVKVNAERTVMWFSGEGCRRLIY